MGTYMGSPWGFIRGKIGDQVGGVWKGVEWVRVRVLPTQRGTLELMRMLKEGLITPERFSWKQFNIRRLIFQVLGWIGKSNMSTMIYPIWEALCSKRKWALTGVNAFIKVNAGRFWNSLPDKDAEYNSATNAPDMKVIRVSDGDLEGAYPVLTAGYVGATGVLTVTWDSTIYENGKDDDFAFAMLYMQPIVRDDWRPNGYLYGTGIPIPPPGVQPLRSDGTMTVQLPIGLIDDMVAYVFFRDALGQIGYSVSNALDVTIT